MADFIRAYERTMNAEGGYVLHEVRNDRGGQTYAGISRRFNPQWPGWAFIDRKEPVPVALVHEFYRVGYWKPLRGDDIESQAVANSIYDFAVNTSAPGKPTVAIKMAQGIVGEKQDGIIGPMTLAALNSVNPNTFLMAFALAKVRYYADIVERSRDQDTFLRGWINRAIRDVPTVV